MLVCRAGGRPIWTLWREGQKRGRWPCGPGSAYCTYLMQVQATRSGRCSCFCKLVAQCGSRLPQKDELVRQEILYNTPEHRRRRALHCRLVIKT